MVKSQFFYVRVLLKCKIFTKVVIVNFNFVNHIVKKRFLSGKKSIFICMNSVEVQKSHFLSSNKKLLFY